METKTQHGYLVLADISGYTAYLAGTELEHAHEILTELLELILHQLTPAMTLSKLEGDAVFVYTPESKFTHGEALLDLIESTYVAFRDHQVNMHHRTTCTCSACRAIPTLDLKFFTHHGDYIVQHISDRQELVGTDVNLAHRLMKNHIAETTGWKGYALYTQRVLEHVGVLPDGMHPQIESYEHLGDVQTYSINLRDRHLAIVEARRVFLDAKDSDIVCIQDFDAPPAVVWDWWNNPLNRTEWMREHNNTWRVGTRLNGRSGVGARNHCAHGDRSGESIETITDWRPFNYVSTESTDGGMRFIETVVFESLDDGRRTRLHDHMIVHLPIALPQFLRRVVVQAIFKYMVNYPQMLQLCARLLHERLAAQTI